MNITVLWAFFIITVIVGFCVVINFYLRQPSLSVSWDMHTAFKQENANITRLIVKSKNDSQWAFFIPNPDISIVKSSTKWMNLQSTLETYNLGNQLFLFAALYGISRRNRITPVVEIKQPWQMKKSLRLVFEAPMVADYVHLKEDLTERFKEHLFAVYDRRTESFAGDSNNITLSGYFQSWKYFEGFESELRMQLKFLSSIENRAKKQLDLTIPGKYQNNSHVLVGIHIRRGDLINKVKLTILGYQTAPLTFFHKAMSYMRKKFRSVIFVICSDDMTWARKNLKDRDVFYSNSEDFGLDFTVLSLMDHNIISVGTFGWWSAWLANGTTIYYKHPFRKNSDLYNRFSPEDHFPKHWIPME